MKLDFFARRALLILCVVFFLVPFGLRGARMSLERMENNVKDWLPDSFEETRELAWFAEHFVGEQSFVLLTWEGCSEKDESYRLYVQKLRNEIKPDEEELIGDERFDIIPDSPEQRVQQRLRELTRARQWGDQLGLHTTGDYFHDWGGLQERWLRGGDQTWYYITPAGELYRWHGRPNLLGALIRLFQRNVLGDRTLDSTLVARFGQPPTATARNPFHDDPGRLTSRVLRTVTTGPEVLAEMSSPGGSMWPIGNYSDEERAKIARRRALDRLKGTLFGPEPYERFAWTAEDLPRVLQEATLAQLPSDWRPTVTRYLEQLVSSQYNGDRAALLADSLLEKEAHWEAMFAALQVEPPGLQTCVMVTLSPAGADDLRRLIGRGLLGKPRGKLVDLAVESGVKAPTKPPIMPLVQHVDATGKVLRMGGPPVDNVAIDEEGQITLVRLVGFSALIGIGLGYLCFRRVSVTIMIFIVGGMSAIMSLSFVWWTGSSVDAILLSMPSLIYVLGLSGAVHIVNYYRETSLEHGVEGAPYRALAHAALPCALAAFTTALGLLSLYQSNIHPIRKFGLFSAIGVMATLAILFTYLPSALQLWPPRYERRREDAGSKSLHHKIEAAWQAVGNWVVDHHWWVAGTTAVIMLTLGLGIGKLNTSIQLLKLFDQDAKIIRDYRWLEDHVGKLVPMELVVSVDESHQYPTMDQRPAAAELTLAEEMQQAYQYSFLERIELTAHVQNAVEEVFGERGQNVLGRGLSAATFTPPILDPLDSQRVTTNSILEQHRDRLMRESYLAVDPDGTELWRVSVRLGALNDVDYGQFVSQLKRVVEPVLKAYEFRDAILQAIDQQRPDVSDPRNRWNDTRIAVLGAADPREEPSRTTGTDVPPPTGAGTGAPAAEARQQDDDQLGVHRVFARVLGDLLRAKGFQGKRGGRIPKRYIAWQDPIRNPLQENAQSEAWAATLASFDCVVVVRDHPDYDLDFIRQHARQVVDARDHSFDPVTGKTAKDLGRSIDVTYTGVVPIVYKAQRTLLHSLIDSIWWAFVMIALVMMVLLRTKRRQLLNFRGGLVSMIPNIFPVIVIFGAMGHLGIIVDIGTMMTASVAMGVAVDDTIHFLTWFRRAIRDGLDRQAAIKVAYSRVSVAMTQTTLISGLGLSVFALSTFTPTQRFGIMMLTLLVAALVGDLILLPALLAGPLGRYFCPKVPPAEPRDERMPQQAEDLTLVNRDRPTAATGSFHVPRHEGRAAASPLVRRDGSHS